MSRVGDRGHPCFHKMRGKRLLLIFITLPVFVYNAFMILCMLLLVPSFTDFSHNKSLETESNAFLKSTKHA